ncbi:MAG: sel1 repeat family protein [Alphaproteobacteria bacterium]|nr:sel1 repeat family protein [Alphaproteobacteria bacterium]
MRRLHLIIALFLALWTGAAHAGPYEDGLAAARRGDFATALRLWKPLAEQGDAEAQQLLGLMYNEGRGVPQDYAEAAKWLRRAAEQGYAAAQYNLGVMYNENRGVPQDYAEAVKWWRRAAEQGHASAQNNLGVSYEKGHGVPRDDAEAVKWYRRAAGRDPSPGHASRARLVARNHVAGAGPRRSLGSPPLRTRCPRCPSTRKPRYPPVSSPRGHTGGMVCRSTGPSTRNKARFWS